MILSEDKAKVAGVINAMNTMKKLDIKGLEEAFEAGA